MSSGQYNAAAVWSVALHVAALVGLAVGIELPERPRMAVSAAPIQGVIVDTAALERERAARDAALRQERQRQQRVEQQRREAEQREQQRVADAARAREQEAQEERDRAAAAKREQERQQQVAREQREREAAAKREREAAAKREREAAEQRRREAELQAAIDLDRERAEAEAAGLLDQYLALIEDAIKDAWNRPLSARPGVDCVVEVVQVQTGDVLSARVASCNGDDAVRRSIERAVFDASPLPRAPVATLFQRNINVRFKPDE